MYQSRRQNEQNQVIEVVDLNTMKTPVKKYNTGGFQSHLKTAESSTLLHTSKKMSVGDIDAQVLFENFDCFITVTQINEEISDGEEYPGRKLVFEEEISPLNFDQGEISIKKKRRGSLLGKSFDEEYYRVKPFQLSQKCENMRTEMKKDGKRDSEMMEERNFPKNGEQKQQVIVLPPLRKRKLSNLMMTPTKKPIKTLIEMQCIQRSAKKRHPFRDLVSNDVRNKK